MNNGNEKVCCPNRKTKEKKRKENTPASPINLDSLPHSSPPTAGALPCRRTTLPLPSPPLFPSPGLSEGTVAVLAGLRACVSPPCAPCATCCAPASLSRLPLLDIDAPPPPNTLTLGLLPVSFNIPPLPLVVVVSFNIPPPPLTNASTPPPSDAPLLLRTITMLEADVLRWRPVPDEGGPPALMLDEDVLRESDGWRDPGRELLLFPDGRRESEGRREGGVVRPTGGEGTSAHGRKRTG